MKEGLARLLLAESVRLENKGTGKKMRAALKRVSEFSAGDTLRPFHSCQRNSKKRKQRRKKP